MKNWPVRLAVIAVVFVLVGIVVVALTDDALGMLKDGVEPAVAYFLTAFFIFGDAIIPILPGETVLNAASVMAANGELWLPAVILAGAMGAIAGDSGLYWIARVNSDRVAPQAARLESDKRVMTVIEILGDRAPLFIVLGRYVPGVRFFVNATMGIQKMPYRKFLLWSVIGGVTWATYTSVLAYSVGTALDDYPIMSVLASGVITTVLIAVIFWFALHPKRDEAPESAE